MEKYSEFETRRQPWFDESNFNGFNFAIPMKTLVIYCVDPRASDIPQAVATHFGDEVYPGEVILDEAGNRIGSTRTLFTVTNGGGRAASALMTVAEMDYLFHVQNVVVVHHSFCGTSSYMPERVFKKFHEDYHTDISTLFDHDSVAIPDFEKSLQYDLELLRSSRQCRGMSSSTASSTRSIPQVDRGVAGYSCIDGGVNTRGQQHERSRLTSTSLLSLAPSWALHSAGQVFGWPVVKPLSFCCTAIPP